MRLIYFLSEDRMSKRSVRILSLGVLLLIPIIGWILPGDFFDDSQVILCPSRLFFDIECFGCGITRAVMHFHHFQFDDAVYYNTLVLLVYPAMAFFWGKWSWQLYRSIKA